jgi:hypothetical protein
VGSWLRVSRHRLTDSVGYAFRADGRYFVLAERHKSKDTLGVYDATDLYKLVRVRPTAFTYMYNPDSIKAFPTPNIIHIIVRFIALGQLCSCLGRSVRGASISR